MLKFSDYTDRISKAVHYHVENKIPLAENIYRYIVKNFIDCLEKPENFIKKEF